MEQLPRLAGLVAAGIGVLVWLWDKQIRLATSAPMAQLQGISATRQQVFFMALLAGFCAVALQAVGSLLISGLLILPALTARLFANSPRMMAVLALMIGELAVSLGIWGSVWLDIPTGIAIVLLLALVFFIGFGISRVRVRA